jgi:hypothetical protein
VTLALAWLWACSPDTPVSVVPSTAGDTASVASPAPGLRIVDRVARPIDQDDAFGEFKRGRGCTVSDVDLDGDPDLVLANPADPTYVLLNDGEGGWSAGPLLSADELVWAVTAADLDGDGDEDLFLAVGGLEGLGYDRLLRNDLVETGRLGYTDVTDLAGVAGPAAEDPRWEGPVPVASLGGHFVDLDGDADLDLYVDTTPWPFLDSDEVPDGTVIGRNLVWRNDGGVFTEVSQELGLQGQGSSRYSSWLDIDHDGDLDLFENNMNQRNVVWRNDGGVFTDVTAVAALDGGDLAYPLESFASAAVDANLDGWTDLVLFVRGVPSEGPYLLGHTLLLNVQGRGFVDATAVANLNDPFYSGNRDHLTNGVMGATLRDLTGEGVPDLFAGNGGPTGGYPNMLAVADELVPHDFGGQVGVLDVPVYRDASGLIQTEAAQLPGSAGNYPIYPYRTHAGCVADLTGDGAVELYVMNGGMSWVGGDAVKEPNRWFEVVHDTPPRWLTVQLVGDGQDVPHTPFGARVVATVVDDGVQRQVTAELQSLTGFAAQHGTEVHLALGQADELVQLEVIWPDGATQQVAAELDQRLRVGRSVE